MVRCNETVTRYVGLLFGMLPIPLQPASVVHFDELRQSSTYHIFDNFIYDDAGLSFVKCQVGLQPTSSDGGRPTPARHSKDQ